MIHTDTLACVKFRSLGTYDDRSNNNNNNMCSSERFDFCAHVRAVHFFPPSRQFFFFTTLSRTLVRVTFSFFVVLAIFFSIKIAYPAFYPTRSVFIGTNRLLLCRHSIGLSGQYRRFWFCGTSASFKCTGHRVTLEIRSYTLKV